MKFRALARLPSTKWRIHFSKTSKFSVSLFKVFFFTMSERRKSQMNDKGRRKSKVHSYTFDMLIFLFSNSLDPSAWTRSSTKFNKRQAYCRLGLIFISQIMRCLLTCQFNFAAYNVHSQTVLISFCKSYHLDKKTERHF